MSAISYRQLVTRERARGASDQELVEILLTVLDGHAETIDDYETYLAEHLNTTKDRCHLSIAMGVEWAQNYTGPINPLIQKYKDRAEQRDPQ